MAVTSDKMGNVERARAEIAKAAAENAAIVVLPEMFCCPYSQACFGDYAEPQGGEVWKAMSRAARDYGVYLVAGSMPERDRERVFNSSFVFDREGNQIARHRKIHLFDIDVPGGQRFHESETLAAGDRVTVFDTEFGLIGLCICFDMRFPELSRLMVRRGAHTIIVPAAFNMTTGPAHWETMFRQRAVDNQIYTVGIAPARDEHGPYVSYGNSIICSPWGDILYRAGAEEQTGIVDLDLQRVAEVRAQLPLLNSLREDVYEIIEKQTSGSDCRSTIIRV